MTNPVYHQFPGNEISPIRMHREVFHPRHKDCVPDCEMVAYCKRRLTMLGHDTSVPPDECGVCERAIEAARPPRPTVFGGVWGGSSTPDN